MNQTRVSLAARDQLINQIIHQGKAKRSALATDTYSRSLSVKGYKLRPVPGSRDKQLNQSQGAGVPKWRARQRLKTRTLQKESTDSISAASLQGASNEYLTWRCD
jgi:hypothetical protein